MHVFRMVFAACVPVFSYEFVSLFTCVCKEHDNSWYDGWRCEFERVNMTSVKVLHVCSVSSLLSCSVNSKSNLT